MKKVQYLCSALEVKISKYTFSLLYLPNIKYNIHFCYKRNLTPVKNYFAIIWCDVHIFIFSKFPFPECPVIYLFKVVYIVDTINYTIKIWDRYHENLILIIYNYSVFGWSYEYNKNICNGCMTKFLFF